MENDFLQGNVVFCLGRSNIDHFMSAIRERFFSASRWITRIKMLIFTVFNRIFTVSLPLN